MIADKPIKEWPQRKAVTIVAGFKSWEGLVLCADTQETIGDAKRHVPKLRFEPREKAGDGVAPDELAVVFCGATNDGVFLDEMVDRAWIEVQDATSLDEACDSIRQTIKGYYREATGLYQPGYVPRTELIFGVKMHRASRLFYSLGPAVTERDTYSSGGVGGYMADFLASRMYSNVLGLRECVILAAYTLFQAKEHVEGCGGESHIAILRNDGLSGSVNWYRIEALTELLKVSDTTAGNMLFHVADLRSSKEDFRQLLDGVVAELESLRDRSKQDIQFHVNMLKAFYGERETGDEDEYGFPTPSASQKSTPEQ